MAFKRQEAEMAGRLITTAEYAERARTSAATIRYWRHVGYGPQGIRLGRRVVYDAAAVESFIGALFAKANGPAAS